MSADIEDLLPTAATVDRRNRSSNDNAPHVDGAVPQLVPRRVKTNPTDDIVGYDIPGTQTIYLKTFGYV